MYWPKRFCLPLTLAICTDSTSIGLSFLLNLGVGRSLLVASLRATAQLLLVGLILKYVFASSNPWLVLAVAMVMVLLAANEVRSRQKKRFAGVWGVGVGACATMVSTVIVLTCAVIFIVEGEPWWAPQLIVPLVGIVLGSVLNSASLCLDTFFSGVASGRAAIEARLALGATRAQALGPLMRESIRKGLIPIANQMSAAGIITLPGIMTGAFLTFVLCIGDYITPQILGGNNELVLPQIIMLQIGRRADFPMAAALSIILMLAVTVAYIACARWLKIERA